MAHKMGAGSTKNDRDSQSKRLGIKANGTQKVNQAKMLVADVTILFLHYKMVLLNTQEQVL